MKIFKSDEKVHLTKEQAKKDDWKCEACGFENALRPIGILPADNSELWECQFCSHRETFLPSGERKLKENYFKYA